MKLLDAKTKKRPVEWAYWNPGLDNEQQTLGEVYKTLPVHEFTSYPLIVRVIENPKSPVALKGKCDLLTHDLIHVLLGRGLHVQDEAFVIGYTMGTSKTIGGFEKELFKLFASRLYPKKYRFKKQDLFVYDLGFSAGQANKIDLFDINLKGMQEIYLGELRASLGINPSLLKHLYAVEQEVIRSRASERIYKTPVFGG
ncbi:hypothetical protein [uncultured Herbaspirillum sp.]|uniref:hypothetical protein n=1 Tax=uncultured Herbaspirillum sp. TaxID=160236 RepID=UPI0025840528|nr:hypothetical protein [uncultured Herbaspirillum sp.]